MIERNRADKLIAGNWKMNGTLADCGPYAAALRAGLAGLPPAARLVVCPPAPLLHPMVQALAGSGVLVGGQDCHAAAKGAHTGDIAAPLLAEIGCRHVILGHSERRADHGETDATVAAKVRAAWAAGLVAIVCLGETEAQRAGGETLAVVARQLAGSLPEGGTAANCVVAYEPVWAIGSGAIPTETEIAVVHAELRARLPDPAIALLYGGSVKPGNAAAILHTEGVDGVLVGGASLSAADLLGIAAAA